jgi:plastocyanin
MNKTTWLSLGIFIAVLGIGAFLLGRQNTSLETTASPTPTPTMTEEMENGDMEEAGEMTEILIEGDEFLFSPSTTTAEVGTVRITFQNNGTMQHDLVFDDLDAGTGRVNPGDAETIEVTIDQPGTYTFYCSINGHRLLGMEGELVVQ